MSYFSTSEEPSLGGWLGCGKDCNCGPCRSGMNGLGERYERDDEEEAPGPAVNGWYGDFGYYGFHDGEPAPGPEAAVQPAPEPSVPEPEPAQPPSTVAPPTTGPQSSSVADEELIQDALRRGVRNPWQLTDIVFFARHPNRKGTPIQPNETELIAERRHIRLRLVLPALRQLFSLRNVSLRRRFVRPRRMQRARFGFAGFGAPPPPVCGAARSDLTTIAADLKLINDEIAKGAGASAVRLDLKKKLLDVDVDGMVSSLDSYIATGCCEPSLKTLASEVNALRWHVSVVSTQARLLREIGAAQARARKDFKHC
ncbi:MAG TPA: hypothetical protein VIB00_07970 [Pyrinomonadaceae bacterium]